MKMFLICSYFKNTTDNMLLEVKLAIGMDSDD